MDKPSIYELIHMVEQVNNASVIQFTEGLSTKIGISSIIVLSEIHRATRCQPIDLAKTLGYSKSSITAIATKLMRAAYIKSIADPHDRRKVFFEVTKNGRELLKEIEQLGHCYYETIYSVLTEEELLQYIHIQKKLLSQLKST